MTRKKEDLISQEQFNKLSSQSDINNIPLPHNSSHDDENRDTYDETLMGMEYALDELEEEQALDDLEEEELSLAEESDEEGALNDDYALEEDDDLRQPEIDRTEYSSTL